MTVPRPPVVVRKVLLVCKALVTCDKHIDPLFRNGKDLMRAENSTQPMVKILLQQYLHDR